MALRLMHLLGYITIHNIHSHSHFILNYYNEIQNSVCHNPLRYYREQTEVNVRLKKNTLIHLNSNVERFETYKFKHKLKFYFIFQSYMQSYIENPILSFGCRGQILHRMSSNATHFQLIENFINFYLSIGLLHFSQMIYYK